MSEIRKDLTHARWHLAGFHAGSQHPARLILAEGAFLPIGFVSVELADQIVEEHNRLIEPTTLPRR